MTHETFRDTQDNHTLELLASLEGGYALGWTSFLEPTCNSFHLFGNPLTGMRGDEQCRSLVSVFGHTCRLPGEQDLATCGNDERHNT